MRCDICGQPFSLVGLHPQTKRCSEKCRAEGRRRRKAVYFRVWYKANRRAVIQRVLLAKRH